MDMGKYTGFLRESDLFFNLTKAQLEMVEAVCEELTFQDGDLVFPENSKENEVYLILHGEIEIIVNPGLVAPRSGIVSRNEVIAVLGRGQSFGEVALVDEGVRTAGARAGKKDTRLVRIPREKLLLLCKTYPELGYQVMLNLAVALSQKIRNADLKIREVLLYQSR
jgi:CRP-like cAMP-binding protein